ncbi:MAG: tRNA lysidine(34) synthetase TilS [Parabacteroides sp.]|nr:tRNA lysidine(34) synthetase TilS [Parabacteroides sp.]
MLLSAVRSYIAEKKLLLPGQPVIVGLSGGADSVALLDLLVAAGYPCIAAHCNFHLRGDESQRDEVHAGQTARRYEVPFVKTDFDTAGYAREYRLSVEMAARELRYRWFEEVRETHGAQAIAVAHHRDDNIETVLLNLLRGTGLRGLRGMRPRNGYIVRPLLAASRADILDYVNRHRLPYITDSSNLSDAYTRNFIRLRVLPLVEKIAPAARTLIARTAEHLGDAEELYRYVIEEARRKAWEGENLRIAAFMAYPAPKTVLYELLRPYGFSRPVTDDLFRSLAGEPGKVFYSPTHRIIKDRDFLILSLNKPEEAVVYTISSETERLEYPVRLSFRKADAGEGFAIEKDKSTGYFDFDKLTFPLTLRRWQAGDWFVPFGMKGRKKVSDYFSDRKFSLAQKESCWLLCCGNEIVWIIGERTDNRFRIDETTRQAFVVKFFGKIP